MRLVFLNGLLMPAGETPKAPQMIWLPDGAAYLMLPDAREVKQIDVVDFDAHGEKRQEWDGSEALGLGVAARLGFTWDVLPSDCRLYRLVDKTFD